MTNSIIDCCSLINLYTGWGGLHELKELGHAWHVADSVLAEAQYTRGFDESGRIVTVALSLDELVQSGELTRARPETQDEIDLYVRLSADLDDGEAEALALAKSRGFVLLTDDAKAVQIAHSPELLVETVSTAAILQAWNSANPLNANRIQEVVSRITSLARFRPRKGAPELNWWQSFL